MDPTIAPQNDWLPDRPGSLGLDKVLEEVSRDDQEEWEYEYSTTETETYYLTVDLSCPEFKDVSTKVAHHSRGGYYKNWLDASQDNATQSSRSAVAAREENPEQDEDEDGQQAEQADDDSMPMDPAVVNAPIKDKGKGKERDHAPAVTSGPDLDGEEEPIDDIQILDLHSRNPIIGYRGKLFEGRWAEVIGTEAIMSNREDQTLGPGELPALRNLQGGVDLLAASSSRIMTTEMRAKPQGPEKNTLAEIRQEWNIRIPFGKDRSGEKAQQAHFLENLIALKKKKGQTDEVTVYTKPGEGKDFSDNKGPDYKPRRKPATDAGEDDRGKRKPGRQPGGRGRQTKKARGAGMDGRATHASTDSRSLSTPTPASWEDLHRQSGARNGGAELDANAAPAVEDEDVDMMMD